MLFGIHYFVKRINLTHLLPINQSSFSSPTEEAFLAVVEFLDLFAICNISVSFVLNAKRTRKECYVYHSNYLMNHHVGKECRRHDKR